MQIRDHCRPPPAAQENRGDDGQHRVGVIAAAEEGSDAGDDADDALDVTQDAFVKAYRNAHKWSATAEVADAISEGFATTALPAAMAAAIGNNSSWMG